MRKLQIRRRLPFILFLIVAGIEYEVCSYFNTNVLLYFVILIVMCSIGGLFERFWRKRKRR